ncbi:MAG: DMT family transporter [Smithellaceae bacterium]|nr:DMT family transporter [Smithellaceae bacterium]
MYDLRHHWLAASLLLLTSFFWGATFTIVKDAISHVDVFVFLAQRFLAAFFLLLMLCLFKRGSVTGQVLRDGVILGIALFCSYAFQTVALKYTSASNTGFLTGLNVVIVPCIGALLLRQTLALNVRIAVLLAVIGLFLLTAGGVWEVNRGDIYAALCAFFVAFHILLTGEYARRNDIFWLTAIQFGVVAALSLFFAIGNGEPVLVLHREILWALVICVLLATIFAFLVQTSAQRFISPTRTALIFCTEPVFAAGWAYFFAGERMGLYGLIGAFFILAAMIIAEAPPKPWRGD